MPVANNSVYVPDTGNNFDATDFNSATNIALNTVTVVDDRVLTLH